MRYSCDEYKTKSLEQSFELAKIKHGKFKKALIEIKEFNADNTGFLTKI